MKYKSIITGIILATSALAGGGISDGTRGGGQTVDIGTIPHLRDLYDNCYWKNLATFMNEQPNMKQILGATAETHWTLAMAIQSEAANIKLCRSTSMLKMVPADDVDGVTVIRDLKNRQVALRVNDLVFLDDALFAQMPVRERSLLLIHEVSHSFIPMSAEQRNNKVRSFVNAISVNAEKRVNRDEFALQIKMNDVLMPETTDAVDSMKADVAKVLGAMVPSKDKLEALNSLDFDTLDANLWYADTDKLDAVANSFYGAAVKAIQKDNVALLEIELNKGLNPALAFLSYSERRLSLLDLAAVQGNDDVIMFLLDHTAVVTKPSAITSPYDTILERTVRGTLDTVPVTKLLALGANPNRKVTFDPKAAEQNRFSVSLAALAVLNERAAIAPLLIEAAITTKETLAETLGASMSVTTATATAARDQILAMGKVDLNKPVPFVGYVISKAIAKNDLALVTKLLISGVNPNQALDAKGTTAFDLALEAKEYDIAGKIATDPRFDVKSLEKSALAGSEDSRVTMLQQFVETDMIDIVTVMVKTFKFSWFDLYRARETARDIRKNEAMAKVIDAAMQR